MLFESVMVIFSFLALTECIEKRFNMDYNRMSKKWDKIMMKLGYNYSLYSVKSTKEGYKCIINIPQCHSYQHLLSIEKILEAELGCFIVSMPLKYRQSKDLNEYGCYQAELRIIYAPNSIPLKEKIYK